MIFLIKLYTILNCVDCMLYQKVIQDYCNRTPTDLQIINTDDINNLSSVLDAKIKSIPYAVFYAYDGRILFNLEGVYSKEAFELAIYNNR